MRRFSTTGSRVRRLVDGSKPDLRTEIFGQTWESPIFICSVLAVAARVPYRWRIGHSARRKAKQTQMILSTQTTFPIEDVNAAYGKPVVSALHHVALGRDQKLVKARYTRISGPGIHRGSAGRTQRGDASPYSATRHAQLRHLPRRRRTRNLRQRANQCTVIHTNGLALADPALTWSSVDRLEEIHPHENRPQRHRHHA